MVLPSPPGRYGGARGGRGGGRTAAAGTVAEARYQQSRLQLEQQMRALETDLAADRETAAANGSSLSPTRAAAGTSPPSGGRGGGEQTWRAQPEDEVAGFVTGAFAQSAGREQAVQRARAAQRKRAALPRPKAGFEPEQAMQSILRLGVRIAKADGPRQPPPTCAQRVAQCLAPPEVPGAAKAAKAGVGPRELAKWQAQIDELTAQLAAWAAWEEGKGETEHFAAVVVQSGFRMLKERRSFRLALQESRVRRRMAEQAATSIQANTRKQQAQQLVAQASGPHHVAPALAVARPSRFLLRGAVAGRTDQHVQFHQTQQHGACAAARMARWQAIQQQAIQQQAIQHQAIQQQAVQQQAVQQQAVQQQAVQQTEQAASAIRVHGPCPHGAGRVAWRPCALRP